MPLYHLSVSSGGYYHVHTIIVDEQGVAETAIIPIEVTYLPDLSENLRQKWAEFNQALREENVSLALSNISEDKKAKYEAMIRALLPHLTRVVDSYTGITLTDARETQIEFIVGRNIEGEEYGYFMYFRRDPDRVWRIYSF